MEKHPKLKPINPSEVCIPELNALLERDPYLKPYEVNIRHRYQFSTYTVVCKKIYFLHNI